MKFVTTFSLGLLLLVGFAGTSFVVSAGSKDDTTAADAAMKLNPVQAAELLQKMLDPNRFYPDLKNDPELYIELPKMAGYWAGFIKDGTQSDTTGANINLISKYTQGHRQHSWFGVYLTPSSDASAWSKSNNILNPQDKVSTYYTIQFRAHRRWERRMSVRFEADADFRDKHPDWDWSTYLVSSLVPRVMESVYTFMEFDSGATKFCEEMIITIHGDYTFSIEGTCEYLQ